VQPIIKSSCPEYGVVLDPFAGSGTTCLVARQLNRDYLGIEVNPAYVVMARKRLAKIPQRLTSFC
jgi:site-specific DNA-methyltransferase (adenine-specific)